MRSAVGAWLVFLVVVVPGVVSLVRGGATNLSLSLLVPYRKLPPDAPELPGHRSAAPVPRASARSAGSEMPAADAATTAHTAPPAFRRDPLGFLSTAPPDSLRLLPGIGPVLADRIAGERSQKRRYTDWSDLLRVRGIGPATVRRLEALAGTDP